MLGLIGLAYAGWLAVDRRARPRSKGDEKPDAGPRTWCRTSRPRRAEFLGNVAESWHPGSVLAAGGLRRGELRGGGPLTWLPDFVFTMFQLDLTQSATVAGCLPAGEPGRCPLRRACSPTRRPRRGGGSGSRRSDCLSGRPGSIWPARRHDPRCSSLALIGDRALQGDLRREHLRLGLRRGPPQGPRDGRRLMNTAGWVFGAAAPSPRPEARIATGSARRSPGRPRFTWSADCSRSWQPWRAARPQGRHHSSPFGRSSARAADVDAAESSRVGELRDGRAASVVGGPGRHQRLLRPDARQRRRHDPDGQPAGRGLRRSRPSSS